MSFLSVSSSVTPKSAHSPWGAIFVWSVFALALAQITWFVIAYASPMPMADDLVLVDVMTYPTGLTWDWLWAAGNEHRNPLPKLIQYLLYLLTNDVRSGMLCVAAILAAGALASILVLRNLRGHLVWTDAALVLIWLQIGNFENLLMGYQISLMLPTLIVWLLGLTVLVRGEDLRPISALLVGVGLASLPLCGGPGFLQAPVLGIWLVWIGTRMWRRKERAARASAIVLFASVASCAAIQVAYLVNLDADPDKIHSYDPLRITGVGARVVSLALGPAGQKWWPASAIGLFVFIFGALWWCLRWMRQDGEKRVRTSALLVVMLAGLALAAGTGYARAGIPGPIGFPIRYVGLTATLLSAAAFGWILCAPVAARWTAITALLLATAAASCLVNPHAAATFGDWKHRAGEDFVDALRTVGDTDSVPANYSDWVDSERGRLRDKIRRMASVRMPPFDHLTLPELPAPQPVYGVMVASRSGHFRPGEYPPGSHLAVEFAAVGSKLYIDVPPGMTHMSGEFAVAYFDLETEAALRFIISYRPDQTRDPGPTDILFDRTLDPRANEADRSPATFDVVLPPNQGGRVTLRILRKTDSDPPHSYGVWRALSFAP